MINGKEKIFIFFKKSLLINLNVISELIIKSKPRIKIKLLALMWVSKKVL